MYLYTDKRKKMSSEQLIVLNNQVSQRQLQKRGYEVTTFVDANLALQTFKRSSYDSGLNGFELYNKMKKIDENIQICFISASNSFYEKYKRLYSEDQEECYIENPPRIKNLARIIDKMYHIPVLD
jgi:two-component SAPR family response regulator